MRKNTNKTKKQTNPGQILILQQIPKLKKIKLF